MNYREENWQWALEIGCVHVKSSSIIHFLHLEAIPGRVGQ